MRDSFATSPLRLLEKVETTDNCWLWKGSTDFGGYGQIRVDKKLIQAHRLSFIFHKGIVPTEKEVIMHLCDNPPCTNPKHLEIGNQSKNMIHAWDVHPYPRKERCRNGHAYNGLNSRGHHVCKICANKSFKKWRIKNG